eukprot:scaffold1679_cov254-Prasinococcus_capsulatus_cf.AAC.3
MRTGRWPSCRRLSPSSSTAVGWSFISRITCGGTICTNHRARPISGAAADDDNNNESARTRKHASARGRQRRARPRRLLVEAAPAGSSGARSRGAAHAPGSRSPTAPGRPRGSAGPGR